jgi:hypothetical protein
LYSAYEPKIISYCHDVHTLECKLHNRLKLFKGVCLWGGCDAKIRGSSAMTFRGGYGLKFFCKKGKQKIVGNDFTLASPILIQDGINA